MRKSLRGPFLLSRKTRERREAWSDKSKGSRGEK
jgi:hypothetical protein